MTDQEHYQLEMYLLGQLSKDEKLALEERLRTDQELRTALIQMRATIVAIRQNALDEKFALLKNEALNQNAGSARIIHIRPMYRWIAAAAVLMLMAILIRPLLETNTTLQNTYLAENFDDFVLHNTQKGAEHPTTDPEIHRAYSLYDIQEFDKAMPLLEKNWKEDRDTLSLFYLWVSAVATEDEKVMETYKEDKQAALDTNKKYADKLTLLRK